MKVNKVSLKPVEYRVLVLPDPVSEYHGKGKLIKKSDTDYTNDMRNQTQGTVVSLSDVAFDTWSGKPPKVGERIVFQRYAGQIYIEGEISYLIMNDKDVTGILKEKA